MLMSDPLNIKCIFFATPSECFFFFENGVLLPINPILTKAEATRGILDTPHTQATPADETRWHVIWRSVSVRSGMLYSQTNVTRFGICFARCMNWFLISVILSYCVFLLLVT